MYLPKHFSDSDQAVLRDLVNTNSFVTLLSFPESGRPFINHLPLIFSSLIGDEKVLIGHMAKRNPQWEQFKKNPAATVIVNGAHAYITPQWYRSGRDVPTWNYAVAHLHGQIELVEDYEGQIEVLKQLTEFFESSNPNPWKFELPADLLDAAALTSAIVSFKFRIDEVEMKLKLSQNRPEVDRLSVIEGLSKRKDDDSHIVREMMLKNEKNIKN